MLLETRRPRPQDLMAMREALLPFYGVDRRVHAALDAFWQSGFERGGMLGQLTFDCSRPNRREVAACATTMMARPEFVDQVLGSTAGGFGEHAIRWFIRGEIPWLTAEATSRESATRGVDVVVLHHAFVLGPTMSENPPEVIEAQVEFYFRIHRGIRFNSYHRSAASADQFAWSKNAGLIHRPRAGDRSAFVVPTPERPEILGMRRDELPLLWGSRGARMFSHHPPRLRLSPLHRDLLAPAMSGATDEELAAALSLSLSAVKKRWISLYDHLDDVASDLFEAPIRVGEESGRRGSERRRHVLNYLREHEEEMNPQAG